MQRRACIHASLRFVHVNPGHMHACMPRGLGIKNFVEVSIYHHACRKAKQTIRKPMQPSNIPVQNFRVTPYKPDCHAYMVNSSMMELCMVTSINTYGGLLQYELPSQLTSCIFKVHVLFQYSWLLAAWPI